MTSTTGMLAPTTRSTGPTSPSSYVVSWAGSSSSDRLGSHNAGSGGAVVKPFLRVGLDANSLTAFGLFGTRQTYTKQSLTTGISCPPGASLQDRKLRSFSASRVSSSRSRHWLPKPNAYRDSETRCASAARA